MFTLPIDTILNSQEKTVKGKTYQTNYWNLQLHVIPGVMKNEQEWCPGKDHDHFKEHDMFLDIWFGQELLINAKLDPRPFVFSKNIADTVVPTKQNLVLQFSGKPTAPDLKNDGHIMLEISVKIEHLDIGAVYETQGYYLTEQTQEKKVAGNFLGENGCQILEVYTPVYVWLLQNQKYFK